MAFAEGQILLADDFVLGRIAVLQRFNDLNLERITEAAVRQALEQTKGNQNRASAPLGIARDSLIQRMKSTAWVATVTEPRPALGIF